MIKMKNFITSIFSLLLLVGLSTDVIAQSTTDGGLEARMAKGVVQGAQIGSVVCENASGTRVLCSGSLEETVLGIVTNVPYVTLNKPATKDGSRFIFDAFVSAEAGVVQKGDYLIAGANGSFVRSETPVSAYAVALDDVSSGQKLVKVKVLSSK